MSFSKKQKVNQMNKTFRASRFLRGIYANIRNYSNTPSHITYEGIYNSFAEAQSKFYTQTGYLTEEYMEGEAKKVSDIVNSEINQYEGNYRERDLLLLLSGMRVLEIKILDVGSGFGLTYHYLRSNLNKNFSYTALDLPKVISIATEIFSQNSNFDSTTLENLEENKYDLVNFGSSLQYFEDYRQTLNKILASNPSTIFISDTPVGKVETFVTLQVNMKDRNIPRWVFSFSEINQIFKDHDYELVSQTVVDWHCDMHNFLNFPNEYHHIRHMNLIFEKLHTKVPSSKTIQNQSGKDKTKDRS